MCVCVCVCVGGRLCVCACVCVCVGGQLAWEGKDSASLPTTLHFSLLRPWSVASPHPTLVFSAVCENRGRLQGEWPGCAHPPESSIPAPGHLLSWGFLGPLTGDVASPPPPGSDCSGVGVVSQVLSWTLLNLRPPGAARELQSWKSCCDPTGQGQVWGREMGCFPLGARWPLPGALP